MVTFQSNNILKWICLTAAFPSALCSPTVFNELHPAARLEARADRITCSKVDPKLPSTFTCASTEFCISIDKSSSVLCCPQGADCTVIQTISCNVTTQDVSTNPSNPLLTTRLKDQLPSCGSSCCPFGYSCVSSGGTDSVCQLDTSKSISGANLTASTSNTASASSTPSATAAPLSTPSSSSPPTSSPSASGDNNPAIIDSNTSHDPPKCTKFPAGVFIAGFLPGIIIGVLSTLAWVIASGRHYSSTSPESPEPTKRGLVISDPIPLASNGFRTDFLRRTTTRAKSIFSARTTPKLSESHWKMPTPPVPNNIMTEKSISATPITPERRLPHEKSMESITIYSPPNLTQPAVAAIVPVRGMAAQRSAPQAPPPATITHMGSPFKTPPNRNEIPMDDSSPTTTFETLTPARYNGGASNVWAGRSPPDVSPDKSRPTTTFTDMLHDINFPDPMMERGRAPAVPKIPNIYAAGR